MKRDFKYIIKRVVIGVLLFLIISFIRNNVFAVSYDRYGDKVYTNFSFVPTSSNWFDSQFVYDMFNNVNQVYNTSYDILDYSYVASYNTETNYYIYLFSKAPLNIDGTYTRINNATNTEYLSIQIDLRNSNPSNRKYTFTHAYNFTSATPNSCSNCYNSNTVAGTVNNTYSFTLTKVIDIQNALENPILNNGSIFENSPTRNFDKYCWSFKNETLFTVLPREELYNSIDLSQNDGEYTIQGGFYSFGYVGNFDDYYNVLRGNYTSRWYAPMPDATSAVTGDRFTELSDITHNFHYLKDSTDLHDRYYNLFTGLYLLDVANNDTYYLDNLNLLKFSHYFNTSYYFNDVGGYNYDIFKYHPTCEFDNDGIGGVVSGNRTCTLQDGTEVHLGPLEELDANLCIFVPSNYQVSILTENSQGGITGNVYLPDGDVDNFTSTVSVEEGLQPNVLNIFNSLQTSDYGLARIIQLPLVLFNDMRDGVCEPYVIPIFDQSISLPCGDTLFWGREDVQTFRDWWNMFFGGIIAYGMAISIYKSIKSLKDPNDDKVEVIKL